MSAEEEKINEQASGQIIELNVGGCVYATTRATLLKSEPNSLLSKVTRGDVEVERDLSRRVFIDRDGCLFKYVLDYLRNESVLCLPSDFTELARLKREAAYFGLAELGQRLDEMSDQDKAKKDANGPPTESSGSDEAKGANKERSLSLKSWNRSHCGCIVVGYRGTFANSRDGMSDVKFRKISRILVCGRVQLCREVFGDSLNESRDPDHGISDRYTSRFYLKHSFLEQAFDTLAESNFQLVCAAATGANAGSPSADKDTKANSDCEENKWLHYNEFVFIRN